MAAVYSREIDGEILTLAASGWTYRNTFVLYDFETETLWYHLNGTDGLTGIAGTYADSVLSEYPSLFTRWSTWLVDNPTSKFLRQD